MDDPRILRVITVGLVLAVLAVVYFLFTGGFSVNKTKTNQISNASSATLGVAASPSPLAVVQAQPKPSATPTSAYNTIAARNQSNVQTLPRTGFPVEIAVVFSAYAVGSGFYLRKYSK